MRKLKPKLTVISLRWDSGRPKIRVYPSRLPTQYCICNMVLQVWREMFSYLETWVDFEGAEEHRGNGICLGNYPKSAERQGRNVYVDCKLFRICFQCPKEPLRRMAGKPWESCLGAIRGRVGSRCMNNACAWPGSPPACRLTIYISEKG